MAAELKDKSFGEVRVLGGLQGWHVNLIRLRRRKCVLAVNDQTRFALFFPGLTKPNFRSFESLFVERLAEELDWLGISRGKAAQAQLLMGRIEYGKTHSRNVLGTMSDMAGILVYLAQRLDKLPETEAERIWVSHQLNEMSCKSSYHHNYIFPADEMRKLVVNR